MGRWAEALVQEMGLSRADGHTGQAHNPEPPRAATAPDNTPPTRAFPG